MLRISSGAPTGAPPADDRPARRGPRAPRPATLALAGLLACLPAPAAAMVDCCKLGSLPPMVSGFHLPAASAKAVLDAAERLGFALPARAGGEPRAGLDRGYLIWLPGSPVAFVGGLPAPAGFPAVEGPRYHKCGRHTVPDRPTFSARGARHPNGALAVTGALAVVADLDAACAVVTREMGVDPRWDARFDAGRDLKALGARSRTATTPDGTTLTLLQPVDPAGPAARWLAAGGPRWLGVVVAVEDLGATAALLARSGVLHERIEIEGPPHLLAEPSGAGGAVIAFFSRARPAPPSLP